MTDIRGAREHLAQLRDDCRGCSGLAMCATHREASQTLSRRGPEAYRAFVSGKSKHGFARMADDIAADIAEVARKRVELSDEFDSFDSSP